MPKSFLDEVTAGVRHQQPKKEWYDHDQVWPLLGIKLPPELSRMVKFVAMATGLSKSVVGRAIIKQWGEEHFGGESLEPLYASFLTMDERAQREVKRRLKAALYGEKE